MTNKEFQLKATQLALANERIVVKALRLFQEMQRLEDEGQKAEDALDTLVSNVRREFEEAFPDKKVIITSDYDIILEG